jgi:hypothetical protein
MRALSAKRKLRILFYIGFVIVIYVAVVYGRDCYHILLVLLYLVFIVAYLVICLKEKGEKECPRCAMRVKVEDKMCSFCYYEFPYQLSLGKKEAENLGVKTKELSDKTLASKSSFEKRNFTIKGCYKKVWGH